MFFGGVLFELSWWVPHLPGVEGNLAFFFSFVLVASFSRRSAHSLIQHIHSTNSDTHPQSLTLFLYRLFIFWTDGLMTKQKHKKVLRLK
jgi:hypothetical protein